MRSPDMFETRLLSSSGDLHARDCAMYDEDGNGAIEELETELNEDDPALLKAQTPYTVKMSPTIKISTNPEGASSRAPCLQSLPMEERRKVLGQLLQVILDAMPRDPNRPQEDSVAKRSDRHLAQELRGVGLAAYDLPEWEKMAYSKALAFGGRSKLSIQEQRQSLPVYRFKNELIQAVHDNQVIVVVGETGSGKTTQMTQTKRVAQELGCLLGEEVGYAVRFEDHTGPDTVIKYMTDGMLLREIMVDENLSRYSVIMLDEAHERTIHTDVLSGLLKQLTKRRPGFRLIVTSATLDAQKFSEYFCNCQILTIPGREHEVKVIYEKSPESNYVAAALTKVMQIHLTEPKGDILLFLTGKEEIDAACQTLNDRMKELEERKRKVVVATNITEASLTIDGIFYVIDPGFAKKNLYKPKQGLDTLAVTHISQASAKQRTARAGRTGPGICYRLYTEIAYNEMSPTTIPEIQRTNLASTALQMKAMGINDLLSFDFMDPPSPQALISAMEQLYSLGALNEEGLLTKLGSKMAEFPLEPPVSKMLLAGVYLGCSDEILTIISMIETGNIFYRPSNKQEEADQKRATFVHPGGDHLTLLAVYEAWEANNFSAAWCCKNFVQPRSLRRVQDVRKQLITILDRYNLGIVSVGKDSTKIRRAIAAGFFFQAAKKDPQKGCYRTILENQQVYIHRSSALFLLQPDWVIYQVLLQTKKEIPWEATKEYMHEITVIDPKWPVEFAPRSFKASDFLKFTVIQSVLERIILINCGMQLPTSSSPGNHLREIEETNSHHFVVLVLFISVPQ
ncbi:hypothetical protein C5167_019351 [Papaver somniferum]|uniref:RNA helicase n=1 Tax=Papaver somniferum TaxID=3469 RepID=A0A4Y7ITA0_PAPSO|nr:hypothetical protein C5167_019351 [Papaver somniferum]